MPLHVTLTKDQLVRAEPLLVPAAKPSKTSEAQAPDGTEWEAFAGKRISASQRTAALETLRELAERYGEVHQLDVQVLANKLAGSAATALTATYEALVAMKRTGHLEQPKEAETITEGLLARLDSGDIKGVAAKHLYKVAGLELYRLFDRPGRDDEFRKELGSDLTSKLRVGQQALRERETERPLTKLAEEFERKRNALAAMLHRTDLPKPLLKLAIEMMGEVGKPEDIERITKAAGDDEELEAAVREATKMIERAKSMKIVLVGFEAAPFCKVGGLSNVLGIGELPEALARAGHQVSVIVPGHEVIDHGPKPANHPPLEDLHEVGTVYGKFAQEFGISKAATEGGVDYYFVEQNDLFSKNRGGVYKDGRGDYGDQPERFDFLSSAAPILYRTISDEPPDIVELADSHVGPAAEYFRRDPFYRNTGTVFAVHNAKEAYQGRFAPGSLANLRLNGTGIHTGSGNDGEAYDSLCYQKIGAMRSDCARTVGFTYLHETQDGEHPESPGGGLHGMYWSLFQQGRYWAAPNGMNLGAWNPSNDPALPASFSFMDQAGKATCKAAVQEDFGLKKDPNAILFGVVARIDHQKGMDSLDQAVRRLMVNEASAQVVICGDAGNGDPRIVEKLHALAAEFPGRVTYDGQFSSRKEHRILAGSDFFVMPSRFEPHGLPQMYSMAYLTVPIGRAVGGIDEAIEAFDPATGKGNGFKFNTDEEMNAAFDSALKWYHSGEEGRQGLIRNLALSAPDFSWDTRTVPELTALYRKVLNDKAYHRKAGAR